MYTPKISEPEIVEIGGEPLSGSGFETEFPANGPEDERSAEEGFNQ
jgi:hypothetical protein